MKYIRIKCDHCNHIIKKDLYALMKQSIINEHLEKSKLSDKQKANLIIEHVADYYEMSVEQMQKNSKCRKRQYVKARQVATLIIKDRTKLTTSMIGMLFDNQDHSTVLHSIRTIKNQLSYDSKLRNQIEDINTSLLI